MIKAVLFDLDGVILDSERLNLLFKKRRLMELKYNLSDELIVNSFGLGKKEATEYYLKLTGLDDLYQDLRSYRRLKMLEYIEENGLPLKDGAVDILKYLKENNIKLALVTSSEKSLLDKYQKYANLFANFDVIITNDLVKNGKPFPDPYYKAVEMLDISPSNCIAIEDSFNGIISAKKSGLRVVYIKDLVELDESKLKYVDYKLSKLTDLKDLLIKLK